MSYEIVYGKQFIKLNDKCIIPMILAGSNNCYECLPNGKERRERNYTPYIPYLRDTPRANDGIFTTPQDLIDRAEKGILETIRDHQSPERQFENEPTPTAEEIRKKYGWYTLLQIGTSTSTTTADMYVNLMKTGIKNALTIEQLKEIGITLQFSTLIFPEETASIEPPASKYITTTDEFFIEYNLWHNWKNENVRMDGKGNIVKNYIYLSFNSTTDFVTSQLKRYRQNHRPAPKPKAPAEQDHYFVLLHTNGRYLYKYTRNGFQHTPYKDSAKKYDTEKTAQKYIDQLLKKMKFHADQWKVEKVNSPARFLKAV